MESTKLFEDLHRMEVECKHYKSNHAQMESYAREKEDDLKRALTNL